MEKLKVARLPVKSVFEQNGSVLFVQLSDHYYVVVVRKRESMQQQVTFGLHLNKISAPTIHPTNIGTIVADFTHQTSYMFNYYDKHRCYKSLSKYITT